jgi:hypothetical protein
MQVTLTFKEFADRIEVGRDVEEAAEKLDAWLSWEKSADFIVFEEVDDFKVSTSEVVLKVVDNNSPKKLEVKVHRDFIRSIEIEHVETRR